MAFSVNFLFFLKFLLLVNGLERVSYFPGPGGNVTCWVYTANDLPSGDSKEWISLCGGTGGGSPGETE